MSGVMRSNVTWNGPSTIRNIPVITMAALDLFNAYKAMVLADGGVIFDEVECLAVIQAALDGDYYWRMSWAISPRWGRKLVAADIAKLYSLRNAVHGMCSGTINLNTVVVAGQQMAEIQALPDKISFAGASILAPGATGCSTGIVMHGAAASIIQANWTSGAEVWAINAGVGASNSMLTVAGVTKYNASPDYSPVSLDALCVGAEMDTQRTFGYLNGAQKKITIPSNGFTPIPAGTTATMELIRSGGTPYLREAWHFNDTGGMPGQDAMVRWSEHAGARS